MLKQVLILWCCTLLLSTFFVANSAPIDQNGRQEKSCILADYFPLDVGNQWTFEVEYQFIKANMGFPTFYNRRGELTIEIVSFSQQNDSTIIYQTAEHFVGVEKRTECIGSSSQKDTAIVFDQYQQQTIREQISGLLSYGSSYINVDECHIVEYGNDSSGGYGFFFSTKRYLSQDSGDTLKVAMGTETGWMFLKNAGLIYFKDGTVGQSSSVRLQIKLIKSEIKNSTSVTRQKNMVERTFELVQNYPNPFNATTTIDFYLQKAGRVSLKVFSMMGQQITCLLDENIAAGAHKITWDAGKLSSGIYYYVLEAQGVKEVRKAILIK